MKTYDIAFLLGSPDISGGTNVIMEHALGLTRMGHRVSIVTERPIEASRLAWKPDAMTLPLFCHAEVKQKMFDLAFATWWRTCYDLPFVPARKYSYFVQSIESRFFPATDPDSKALAEYTYRMPMPVVTEASWIAKYLGGNYGRNVSLVLNGIDKATFNTDGPVVEPRRERALRVLIEGPLGIEFKRTELALDLCRQAGVMDLWLLTSSECTSMPGCSRVLSRIPVTKVGEVYRSCDVLVKLSTVEGMFGPPLEMFHCGGTAITTDVTGHDEYMRHGKNGIIVKRGSESEVVEYLRSMERDPAFVTALKQGAIETARAWPDWPASTRQFEAFVRDTIEKPDSARSSTDNMLVALRGALRLAGPLREASRREISGREALNRVKQKAKERIARQFPPLSPILNLPAIEAKPVRTPWSGAALPDMRSRGTLVRKPTYRVAFVTPRSGHTWHIPVTGSARLASLHIAHDGPPTRRDLQQLAAFRPDVVFVTAPEQFTRRDIENLPGLIVGHTASPADASRIELLKELFPANDTRVGVAHHDTRQIAPLASAGVRMLGTLQRGIDLPALRSHDDFSMWERRPINVAYVGKPTRATQAILEELAEVPGFTRLDPDTDDRTLIGLIKQSRFTLHLPGEQGTCVDAALAIRDMACGCQVIAPRFEIECGLLGGEHYSYYHDLPMLPTVLRNVVEMPDTQDVVRTIGMQRAEEYDAARDTVIFIERYLCQPQVSDTVVVTKSQGVRR
ncbi:MAG: glycosyltransferase family 4 protein [Planctomycetes bacterium]|nr:glycosyltransferase family 4 protein [Planctomycetota bacterium]